jgi:adenine-specific DNA-methyltransferase
MAYSLKYKGKMQGENYQLDKEPLQNMPIPKIIPQEISKTINKLVDKIIAAKTRNVLADTLSFERQLDNLVYRLYNLTYEEVKVIEPDFPLSEAEYDE